MDTRSQRKCGFCQAGKLQIDRTRLLETLPTTDGTGSVPCRRGIFEDEYCVATLAPEQYTRGHTLLILKNHRTDVTDTDITGEELSGFINALTKLARHLKDRLGNQDSRRPERIYVCCLCDGIEHLHAHLIPRYPFTDEDKTTYRQQFEERDGRQKIEEALSTCELGGFWYIAKREKDYTKADFWSKPDEDRARDLEQLARELKLSG
ncbi:hypothetical protein ES703_36709 [subsurface metagenome]